jgi:hypothetical protein
VSICDVKVADGLFFSSHCAMTSPKVMIHPVLFAAIVVFSFVFVIPDIYLLAFKWYNCANGQLNCFLQFASATHLILLSGLCRTDVRCCFNVP